MIPENIRALCFILALAALAFGMSRRPVGFAVRDDDFIARRNTWVLVTLFTFLAYNYWVFIALSALVIAISARRDSNPIALYAFVLLAAPPISQKIPGLGIVNYLFEIDYLRLLSLVILLPALAHLKHRRWMPTDFMILGYLMIQIVLRAQVDSATNTAREIFHMALDVVLPYYVASRSIRSLAQLRDVLVSFAAGAFVMALIAMFEAARGWMLYRTVERVLDADWAYGGYLRRDGLVRANGTTGQAIVLGYVLVVAVMCWGYCKDALRASRVWWIGMFVLLGGAFASLSRGPIVGLVVAWVVYRLLGPNGAKGTLRLALITLMIAGFLAITPMGDTIKEYIPFVGSVDARNVTYRQLLFEVSMSLIERSPWFGVPNYYSMLIEAGLMQGQGIVDMVNSYLAIALSIGVVALAFFVSAFVAVLWPLTKLLRSKSRISDDVRSMGAMLVALLVGTMLIIATVSSILVVPYVYWMLVGLGVNFLLQCRSGATVASAEPTPVARAAPMPYRAQRARS